MPSFRVHRGDSISVIRCCRMWDRTGVSARIVANTATPCGDGRRRPRGIAVPAWWISGAGALCRHEFWRGL